jgi:cytochrome P450
MKACTVGEEKLEVDEGVAIQSNVWSIHYNKKIWGADADSFRPERYVNRIASFSKCQAKTAFDCLKYFSAQFEITIIFSAACKNLDNFRRCRRKFHYHIYSNRSTVSNISTSPYFSPAVVQESFCV